MQINHPINGDGDDIADIVYESSTWMLQYNSQSQTQKMCFEIQSKTYMIWYRAEHPSYEHAGFQHMMMTNMIKSDHQ